MQHIGRYMLLLANPQHKKRIHQASFKILKTMFAKNKHFMIYDNGRLMVISLLDTSKKIRSVASFSCVVLHLNVL